MLIERLLYPLMHSLRDGEGLAGLNGDHNGEIPKDADRGDSVAEKKEPPPTDEEAKLAAELKAKEEKDAADKKAGDDKAAADKKAADKKAVGEKDDADDKDKDKKDTRIPLSRHKTLLETERREKDAALARLAKYEGADELAKTNVALKKAEDSVISMEEDHAKLVNDGKTAEAAALMRKIRLAERDINETRTDLKMQAAESRAYERARYDSVVERIEEAYPELNPDNEDDYNEAIAGKVLRLARGYQVGGNLTPAKALQDAVKDLLGEPKNAKQKEAVEAKPRVSEADAKKAAREEEARQKATNAAGKQPPNTDKGGGKDSDQLGSQGVLKAEDVMKMTFDDFSKLDQATLARMRGDVTA